MVPELHDTLSELRRQLVDLLQEEAECLRKALEVSKAVGQGPEFNAAMRRVEAIRTARGEIVKRIHQLEGRDPAGARPLPDPHVPRDLPDPAMLAAAGPRGGFTHTHR